MMNYSYDPTKITDNDFNQMRFELGDVEVSGGSETCALCDEEYHAMILKATNDGRGWKWAMFLCLKAIRMRFSFEVDSSIGGMSLSLSQRYRRWDKLYLRMQKNFQCPTANPQSIGEGYPDNGHYFQLGKGNNPHTLGSPSPWRGFPYSL